jgi:hypothetical protein
MSDEVKYVANFSFDCKPRKEVETTHLDAVTRMQIKYLCDGFENANCVVIGKERKATVG